MCDNWKFLNLQHLQATATCKDLSAAILSKPEIVKKWMLELSQHASCLGITSKAFFN